MNLLQQHQRPLAETLQREQFKILLQLLHLQTIGILWTNLPDYWDIVDEFTRLRQFIPRGNSDQTYVEGFVQYHTNRQHERVRMLGINVKTIRNREIWGPLQRRRGPLQRRSGK